MERIVLLRSCHAVAACSPCALPAQGDELHVTISVTNGDSIAGTPHNDTTEGNHRSSSSVMTTEPIAEDLLGVNKSLGGSALVHTIKIPLNEYNGRVTIEDVATSALFNPTSEVSVFCVLHSNGVATSSPLFSAYTKVSNFQPTPHPDVQLVQHVGLRLSNDSTGVCMTIAKAPAATDRSIEGALASEHLRCYHDHVVQWQLERAFHTKNAAVDELIQSDLLLSDEIRRQRLAIGSHQPQDAASPDDEVTQLRSKVKELELERVKELEAMRKLIAERRSEREAHIEARLKESRPTVGSARTLGSGGANARPPSLASVGRTTPQRTAPSRAGATTPLRNSSAAGPRASTPTRSSVSAVVTSRTTPQRSGTPTRTAPSATPNNASARRSSVAASATPTAQRTPAGRTTGAAASTPSQAAMLKRAEDNLMRLRGDATPQPLNGSRLGASSSRPGTSGTVGIRNASPGPSRGVPPPPADLRASPLRTTAAPAVGATPAADGSTRRSITGTPVRSSTPTKLSSSAGGSKSSPLIKTNTQSLIRMARQ